MRNGYNPKITAHQSTMIPHTSPLIHLATYWCERENLKTTVPKNYYCESSDSFKATQLAGLSTTAKWKPRQAYQKLTAHMFKITIWYWCNKLK